MSQSLDLDLWGNPAPESVHKKRAKPARPSYTEIVASMSPVMRAQLEPLTWKERDGFAQRWYDAGKQREKARERGHRRTEAGNPMLAVYGAGPDGVTCATCRHLYRKMYDKVYWKCRARGNSNSTATDHRKKWPACGKYEALTDTHEDGGTAA